MPGACAPCVVALTAHRRTGRRDLIGQAGEAAIGFLATIDRWNMENGSTPALAWACKVGTLAAPYTTAGAHVSAALAWLICMSRVAVAPCL